MITKNDFIKATEEYNTFENNVPAYYFRQAYDSKGERYAKITIADYEQSSRGQAVLLQQ